MTDQPNIVPFGKHKGRLIEEVLVDDPGYLQWLAGQAWFRDKYVNLYQIVINRGSPPEETPEHNALQVKFLDEQFCRRFLRCLVSTEFPFEIEVDFEDRGVDVVLVIPNKRRDALDEPWRSIFRHDRLIKMAQYNFEREATLTIELKPTVGDDYPAVLRQMKANGSAVLLLRDYVGTGATVEQFIKTFATAGKRVVFLSEVESQP